MEKDIDFAEKMKLNKRDNHLTKEDVRMMSPLKLAYVGDSVYELVIRIHVVEGRLKLNDLHKLKVKYVNAKAQSEVLHGIEGKLTEEEKEIVRRGRNSKVKTIPKSSSLMDYKHATALEALIGYLFLIKEDERLYELMEVGLRCIK